MGQFPGKFLRFLDHILPKLVSLRYLYAADSIGLVSLCLTAPKCNVLGEMTQNNGHITRFKVIQGHLFWYQSKARICDFLLVNNTKLHSLSHRFQDIADYWPNFSCRQRVPLFNALVRCEPLNSGLREFGPYFLWYGAKHISMARTIGVTVTRECYWANRRTNILLANAALRYVAAKKLLAGLLRRGGSTPYSDSTAPLSVTLWSNTTHGTT